MNIFSSIKRLAVNTVNRATTLLRSRYGIWRSQFFSLSTTNLDLKTEAGLLWENSMVAAAINWYCRTLSAPTIRVRKRDDSDKWAWQKKHQVETLLRRPNKFYSGKILLLAIILEAVVNGNVYIYKHRSAFGKVIGLEYIPSHEVEPWLFGSDESIPPALGITKSDGYIDAFKHETDGRLQWLRVRDVIHIRNGPPNPFNPRVSIAPLLCVLREVCTDIEAQVYTHSILKHKGVPGVIVSREDLDSDGQPRKFTKEQRDSFNKNWNENHTGENRGKPFLSEIPLKVQDYTFDPKSLLLDKIRQIPESRIAAVLGIPAVVLQFMVGLSTSTAKASHEDSNKQAMENAGLPLMQTISEGLSFGLQGEPGGLDDDEEVSFDISEIAYMQESRNDLHDRVGKDWDRDLITHDGAMNETGRQVDPARKGKYKSDLAQERMEAQVALDPEAKPNDDSKRQDSKNPKLKDDNSGPD